MQQRIITLIGVLVANYIGAHNQVNAWIMVDQMSSTSKTMTDPQGVRQH